MSKTNESLMINLSLNGVDESVKKAERYVELLKEAKTIADELVSVEFGVCITQEK